MAHGERDETRIFARLPGLDIAVIHRAADADGGEQMILALRTPPSVEEFGRLIEATNPLLVWSRMTQALWAAWIGGFAAALLPPRIPARR